MGWIARRLGGIAGLLLGVFLCVTALEAQSQGANDAPASAPKGFDYWQPDWMVRELWGPGRMPRSMMVRLLRHTTYMQFSVPDAYAGAKSPFAGDPAAIAAGRKLYADKCLRCHSADGMGSGEAGLALSPSPALLAYMIRRPVAVDEYLMWTIADGGKQFDSEMPAYKNDLPGDDIWRIIAYMRAGFPVEGAKPAK
jgi:mono/diheme cytochrome c family protein